MPREAGVLLHPSSLPGPFGVGDVGPTASRFLDWMAEAGLKVWQILPLGPAGPGGSPYSSPSAFAGNPVLLSPERIAEHDWFSNRPPATLPDAERVNWTAASAAKADLLRAAWQRFRDDAGDAQHAEFEAFASHPDQRHWLSDWALWISLRRLAGHQWTNWPAPLKRRQPEALAAAEHDLREETNFQRFVQFQFATQWATTRRRAGERGITILGDAPFYVSHDSVDVWANQRLFELDADGLPQRVAGVPPDYFSDDGQLWGNPLYDWSELAATGYDWWLRRLESELRRTDRLRLDHFRAFAAYWVVDAAAETAKDGHWTPGPGDRFFEAARKRLGHLPIVAEDLGDIDDAVLELRDRFGLPGMKVLQFGLLDETNVHHDSHHGPDYVAYSGTHDNDTAAGWYAGLEHHERCRLTGDPPAAPADAAWSIVERTFHSAADTAIVPLQDLLGLGRDARMNRPGEPGGNWSWRVRGDALTLKLAARVRRLVEAAGRG